MLINDDHKIKNIYFMPPGEAPKGPAEEKKGPATGTENKPDDYSKDANRQNLYKRCEETIQALRAGGQEARATALEQQLKNIRQYEADRTNWNFIDLPEVAGNLQRRLDGLDRAKQQATIVVPETVIVERAPAQKPAAAPTNAPAKVPAATASVGPAPDAIPGPVVMTEPGTQTPERHETISVAPPTDVRQAAQSYFYNGANPREGHPVLTAGDGSRWEASLNNPTAENSEIKYRKIA